MHRGRKSSTQSPATTKFWAAQVRYPAGDILARAAKRPLSLVGESAESLFAHADDSGPPTLDRVLESAPASATLRDSTHSEKLKDGTFRTDHGNTICREWSCSHEKCSDPCPRQLSHVCILCLQPHRLACCLVQQKRAMTIVLQRTKAAGNDIVMAVRECHTLPRRQLVTPTLWLSSRLRISLSLSSMRSSGTTTPCRSQQKGESSHCILSLCLLAKAIAARLVIVADGDADNPLELTVVTSGEHFIATVDHPPNWFVVSISCDELVLWAHSGQCFRWLSSARGYGDSPTAFENKIID